MEETEGVRFLTMQLVEGKPLSKLIPRDGMPLERIFDIAIPLADALATAHEKGVIHRDLKPANIMLSDEGRAKILDFGLAKLQPGPSGSMDTELPTEPLTGQGRILGTVPYMAPEQVEGKSLDSRSDTFSMGVVLYEMASGTRPFQGESSTSTMARILESEPEQLGELRPDLPPEFLRIVRRCLRKKPEDRYNDTRDLLVALKDLRQDSSSQFSGQISRTGAFSETSFHRKSRLSLALVAAVLAVSVIAVAFILPRLTRRAPTPTLARHQQITFTGDARSPEISADGTLLAFLTRKGVTVHDLEGGGAIELLEFDYPPDYPPYLRWSNDGVLLLVSGVLDGEHASLVVPRLGGSEKLLTYAGGHVCWSPDDSQIARAFTNQKEIHLVDLESGEISETIPISGEYRWTLGIDWSAQLNRLLVFTMSDDDSSAIRTLTPDGLSQTLVFEGDQEIRSAKWSLTEPAIYFLQSSGQDSELWKINVSARSGEATGSASPIQTGLQAGHRLSLSQVGPKLAYARTVQYSTLWKLDADVARDGQRVPRTQLLGGTSPSVGFSLSPDGSQLAIARGQGDSDIFTLSLVDGSMSQLTSLDGRNVSPVWSPDGGRIAFSSTHENRPRVWITRAGGGVPEVLPTGEVSTGGELAWSPGERLLYQKPGNNMFHVFDTARNSEEPLLSEYLQDAGWYFVPVYSSDGSRVALHANLGGSTLLTIPAHEQGHPPRILARQGERFLGHFYQQLDADDYQGRDIKLQARVKFSGGGQGRLFLYARLEDGGFGSHDYTGNRTTTNSEWTDLEFTRKIDVNAARVFFGGSLEGSGAMWADEFRLSLGGTNGEWESLPIKDPSFEESEPSGDLVGWVAISSNLVSYSVSSEDSTDGQRAMVGRELAKPAEGDFYPIGWSPDDEFIYLISGAGEPIIYRIPSDGGEVEPYVDLEISDPIEWASISKDGATIVVETVNEQTDVWVTEGFDPDLN